MKTPSMIVAEVLGLSQLDVVCLDAEHAPFGRLELDACIAALRAADMPSLVRVASDSPHDIRNALDSGATGILVPHVTSGEQAKAIVKAAHFGEGGRGYAGSPRAAGYGTKAMADHRSDSDQHTAVVLQIEDLAALDHVQAIAESGADAVFIGRADLAVAMDQPVSAPEVIDAVRAVCDTASRAGVTVGMFTPALNEIPAWREAGAELFLLASDHAFLIGGANRLVESVAP
ncbi:MAG: aldolase/citrate lyase family protein [Pseudomonadota bacterium]